MATSSISGLASGLDTASIIDQLMQLEAVPQNRLKSRITSEKSVVTALQAVNTNCAVLAGKAETLAKPGTWQALTAKSSNNNVSVTASTSASPTTLSVEVTSVARSHQLGFADAHALTDGVTGASTTVTLDRLDGTTLSLDTGDGTLQGLADAINDPANKTGLRASTIRVGEGQYRLLVESTTTGAAEDFTITAEDGNDLMGGATVRAASDAAISLGTGITATSANGTFTDLLPGVSVTLGASAAVGDTSTLTVARDTAGVTGKVKDLVDNLNTLLTELDAKTASGGTSGAAGVLAGDAGMRSLRSSLLTSVYPADNTSMAKFGIQVTRGGKLELDSAKLAEAYAADPEGVAAAFSSAGGGFAARLQKVSQSASSPTGGTITGAITGRNNGIDRLEGDVENWDLRLELRRATLTRQFTALETALSRMSSQSEWLAGQISSLPTYS